MKGALQGFCNGCEKRFRRVPDEARRRVSQEVSEWESGVDGSRKNHGPTKALVAPDRRMDPYVSVKPST